MTIWYILLFVCVCDFFSFQLLCWIISYVKKNRGQIEFILYLSIEYLAHTVSIQSVAVIFISFVIRQVNQLGELSLSRSLSVDIDITTLVI